MPKEFSRTARVSQQLQKELALILQREISDPKIGMTTISGVEVSRDLAYATVFVTFFCLEHQTPEASLASLIEEAPHIRKLLGKRIRLRLTPEIRFEYDSSLVEGMRMSNLLTQVVKQDELAKKNVIAKDSDHE